jgi:hypothetical protein
LWHFNLDHIMKNGFVLGLAALLAHAATAEIIYDNSTTPEDTFNDSLLETGDEVLVTGAARFVIGFAFEYFAEFTATGDETARVRFYEMNGAPGGNDFATPGTLFYDSGAFNISSGYRTVNITDMGALLTGNKFTWSVEFAGVTEAESAGLLYYNPPTVGSSDDYFWEKENGAWTAVATDSTGNNFAARVTAGDATANFRISNLQRQNTVVTLTVTGAVSGRAYSLEYKNLVNSGSWQRAPGQTTASGETLTLTDATASAPFRFYRVVQVN